MAVRQVVLVDAIVVPAVVPIALTCAYRHCCIGTTTTAVSTFYASERETNEIP